METTRLSLTLFLSGEVHSTWRDSFIEAVEARQLPIQFIAPVTEHAASDNAGEVLGHEDQSFWKDQKSAKVNAIRIRTGIQRADVVIVKFGEKYRQWNAAFDAGFATALGKPLIVIHPPDFQHALKEIDAAALAVAETQEQVIEVLAYLTQQK